MTKIELAEKLGKRWTKGEMNRIYIDLDKIGILNVSRYNTGNIAGAIWYDGDSISNTQAGKLLAVKFWLDVKTQTVDYKSVGTGADVDYVAKAVAKIESMLADAEVTA